MVVGILDLHISVTTSITGTANQVLANGTSGVQQFGDVVLTLPQNIGTTSSPTFSGLNLNGFRSGTLSLLASAITGTNTITFPDATGTVALVGSSSNSFSAHVCK